MCKNQTHQSHNLTFAPLSPPTAVSFFFKTEHYRADNYKNYSRIRRDRIIFFYFRSKRSNGDVHCEYFTRKFLFENVYLSMYISRQVHEGKRDLKCPRMSGRGREVNVTSDTALMPGEGLGSGGNGIVNTTV